MDKIKLLKLGLSEMLATAMLLFICCLGCVKSEFYTPTLFTIVFIVSLDVILVLNIFIKISGAHINPAITVAAFVYKLVDFKVRKFLSCVSKIK
jgi:aquaporin related protein